MSTVDPKSDAGWEQLGDKWQKYICDWVGSGLNISDVKETKVREDFIRPFLDAAGWVPDEIHPEVQITIQLGHESKRGTADYVLAPLSAIKTEGDKKSWGGIVGEAWAVIEAKGPGKPDAQDQARSYADRLRAPVYAVIDGDNIIVWRRNLVNKDEEIVNISSINAKTLLNNRQLLEKWLGSESLKEYLAQLQQGKTPQEAEKNLPTLSHPHTFDISLSWEPDDSCTGGRLSSGEPLNNLIDATTWWGEFQSDKRPQLRLRIRGKILAPKADLSPELERLVNMVLRLLIHGTLEHLYVDYPEEWKARLNEIPLLQMKDAQYRTNLAQRITEPQGQMSSQPSSGYISSDFMDELVKPLRAALDNWMLDRLSYQMDLLFDEDYKTPDSLNGWTEDGKSIVQELKKEWEIWHPDESKYKTSETRFCSKWLLGSLQAGDGEPEEDRARLRLGPACEQYLLKGLLSTLVIKAMGATSSLCLQTPLRFARNLQHGDGNSKAWGFSYALPAFRDKTFTLGLGLMGRDNSLYIYSAVNRSAALVSSFPIGTSPHQGAPSSVGSPSKPLVFCFGGDTESKIPEGWDELTRHLKLAAGMVLNTPPKGAP